LRKGKPLNPKSKSGHPILKMAIYHLSVKNIGRSDGRSAVACAAYRAGEKLIDNTYGKEQDYTKKTGVEFKKIYAPENAKKELLDRESLWNAVEQSETKKNGDLKETARLAKEFEVAFPCEISKEQRELMLDDLCKRLVEKHGVIVDAVIHAPHTAGGSDERNYHAHIMFTTRTINERGELGKKAREFNDDGRNLTVEYRAYWAELENRELERAGSSERVSHLSNKERGIDLEPTVHEGSKITELRRQGIDTEISLKNDAIKARNAEIQLIRGLEQEIIATERLVANLQRDQEQRQKENERPQLTDTEKRVLAQKIIQKFNHDVHQIASRLAMNEQQKQHDQIRHSLEIVQRERNNLEMQMTNMGKRPALFGGKDWDAKHDRLKAEWHRTNEKEKELKGEIQKADPARYRDQAIAEISRENPKQRDNFDKAKAYIERQGQNQDKGKDQDKDKQAERQARLDAARAIGEAEKANKAQLDKERAERAEQQRQQRMR